MTGKKRAMVLAGFAADSLALGAHWIYDTDQLFKTCGRVETLLKPGPNSYHHTRDKGDFTHYGDQILVLLQSLTEKRGFDLKDFSDRWRALFADYTGYIDGATRKTLAYYAKGKGPETAGSHTPDFSGAARIGPIIFFYADDLEKMVKAARDQTAMTHHDPLTLDTSEFFARTAHAVLGGARPAAAMADIASQEPFDMTPIAMWVEEGLTSRHQETIAAIGRFGQACETKLVFPGVVHLIARYEDHLKEALIQSVMAGGESAARGIMTGIILGAHLGMESIPKEWVSQINKRLEIFDLLEKIS
jgi:ADP-ribosylglycohydrolase